MKTKTLTIQLNDEQLPILPVEPEAHLSFTTHADGNELELTGNRAGLLLLAGAWLLLRLLPGLDTTPWRAVPFLCLGVGCGLFGGGTGELLAVQAMKKHPELQKQNEIAERDERNVAIGNAAKAKGYDVMTFAFGAMLLFSVLMEADLALTLVMVAVYLFIQFYSLWWRFKLEKEM